jgi:hypothetical protein
MPLICILKSNQSSLDKKQKTVPFNEQKSHGFSLLLRIEIEEVNNVAPLIGEIKKRNTNLASCSSFQEICLNQLFLSFCQVRQSLS